MIVGIGIDSVEVERFATWHLYPPKQLRKVFGEHELSYSLSVPIKRAERLAARFAVKEAFFKAYSQFAPRNNVPLLTVCTCVTLITAPQSAPTLAIDWNKLEKTSGKPIGIEPICHVSITHTARVANALVIFETSTQEHENKQTLIR